MGTSPAAPTKQLDEVWDEECDACPPAEGSVCFALRWLRREKSRLSYTSSPTLRRLHFVHPLRRWVKLTWWRNQGQASHGCGIRGSGVAP